MAEIIIDSLVDAAKLLPILLPMYVLIEVIERHALKAFIKPLSSRYWSVAAATTLGIVPQCGFSVVATKLYSKKIITLGALVAVLISSSDEAIPILLTSPQKLFSLIGIKFLMALVAGFSINAFLHRFQKTQPVSTESESLDHCHDETIYQNSDEKHCHNENQSCSKIDDHIHGFGCHRHEIGSNRNNFLTNYLVHPMIHVGTVFVFIFLINIIFGSIISLVGQENLTAFMKSNGALQPLLASIIGLIPNCASSVAISQMFSLSQINLGAAVAGLSVNAGISYIVLFRENRKSLKKCFIIISSIFVYSVICGTIIYFISAI